MYFGKGRVEGCYGSRIFYGENADNEVILSECRNEKGEVVVTVCNWAIHSTVLDTENALLTADYAGTVCKEIYQLKGYYSVMLVSAFGGCSNCAW